MKETAKAVRMWTGALNGVTGNLLDAPGIFVARGFGPTRGGAFIRGLKPAVFSLQ